MTGEVNLSTEIHIDGRRISKDDPVYFIAEIGSNFDQDMDRAKDLIYKAKEAGADAAKFQHYNAHSLVSDYGFSNLGVKNSHQSTWKKSVYETYKAASLNQNWTEVLRDTCKIAGLSFFTSPYSLSLVDFVDDFVPAYKIGSGDITWTEIIKHIASKGKPILLATGASNENDVKRAVRAVTKFNSQLILLQCNTNYTIDRKNFSHLHLNVIPRFQHLFSGIITGLSDHTPGDTSVLGAVALGAKVIEKHFTDSTDRLGPDHSFSMTPETWREMVDKTRDLEAALGTDVKKVEKNEEETKVLQRRSLCASTDLKRGALISKDSLNVLRPCPADSIEPYELENIIGRFLARDVSAGQPICWEDLI